MPLKAALTKAQFDALDDAQKALYAAQDSNPDVYLLQVQAVEIADGAYGLEDIKGLRNALGAERKRADDLDNGVATPKAYDGIGPSDAKGLKGRVEKLEALDPDAKASELAEAKIESIRQGILDQVSGEHTALQAKNDRLKTQVVDLAKDQARDAYMKSGGSSLLLFNPMLDSMIGTTEREDGSVDTRILDASGNPETRMNGNTLADVTWSQKVESMRADPQFGGIFDGTGHSGAGTESTETRPAVPNNSPPGAAGPAAVVSPENIGEHLADIASGKVTVAGYQGQEATP